MIHGAIRWFLFWQCDPENNVNKPSSAEAQEGHKKACSPDPGGNECVRSESSTDSTDHHIRFRLAEVLEKVHGINLADSVNQVGSKIRCLIRFHVFRPL